MMCSQANDHRYLVSNIIIKTRSDFTYSLLHIIITSILSDNLQFIIFNNVINLNSLTRINNTNVLPLQGFEIINAKPFQKMFMIGDTIYSCTNVSFILYTILCYN